jgi:hypothetical protein
MKKSLYFILVAITLSSFGYKKYSLYGKAVEDDIEDGTISAAFDRFGDIYPDFKINDLVLRKNQAALELYYKYSKEFRKELIIGYPDKDTTYQNIQKLIVSRKAAKINDVLNKNEINSVTFIMVGYNNHYDDAYPKLKNLKGKIETFLSKNGKKSLVIKVYWDGRYKNTLTGVSYGNPSSYYAGLGLRELISQLKCDEIVMISHSLGANVICETLFNQDAKVTNYDSVKPYLTDLYLKNYYKTPKQKVIVGIVAPAIPGKNTFEDYTKRSEPYDSKNDNYKILVGFNSNDYALRKGLGGYFRTHFSSTSLGGSINEYNDVKKQFSNYGVPDNINMVNFSFFASGKRHRKHDLTTYIGMSEYNILLEKIYLVK